MLTFMMIGVAGLVLLVFSFLFDGLADLLDVGDGALSAPALAAFLGVFGFAGVLALRSGLSTGQAAAVGMAAGLAAGLVVGRLASSLMDMPTDGTVSSGSYLGLSASVLTAVRPGGVGEVVLTVGGQPVKVAARSNLEREVPAGSQVTVVAVPSPTLVVVEPA